jgi:AraC-like DNA-binding protein
MKIIRNKNAPFLELKDGGEEEFSVRKHSHKEISIGIIETGKADAVVKDQSFSLKTNDSILIPSDTVHLCVPDRENEYYFRIIYIDTEWAKDILKIEPEKITPAAKHLSGKEKEEIERFFKTFGTETDSLKLESDCILFLDLLLNKIFYLENRKELKKPGTERIEKIRKYLDENYSSNISLDELADLSGLNKYHALRLFKKKYKITPHAYITNLRFNKAVMLLKNGMLPADVCYECGFFDQSHFTKTFKQYSGMSPDKYRK